MAWATGRRPGRLCGWIGRAGVVLLVGLMAAAGLSLSAAKGGAQEAEAPPAPPLHAGGAGGGPGHEAAPAGEHGGGETGLLAQLNIKPPLLLVNIVGFVLLWMLLKKFLWKPAGEFLAQRQQTIQNTIDEAERQRAEMQRMREEYEQRLEEIEQEHRDRIQAAQREAHAARDELLAEARAERDRVVAAGVREIQREKEKALVEIRDQVADLAVLAAAQVIGRELDERTHRSLISGVIEGVGRN